VQENPAPSEKVDIYAYLAVLVKYRRFIFLNLLVVCLIVAAISFMLPSWYRATTTILPPGGDAVSLGLASSLLGSASGLATSLSLPFMTSPSDIVAAILRSRAVGEAVVQKQNLMEAFHSRSMENAIRDLFSKTSVSVTNEGLISLSYEDRDPVRAAQVANSFVQEADRINRQTSSSQAKSARVFIGERLSQTERDLAQAEENLKAFQEENKTILLDDQMKAAIDKAADLKAQMISSEIELNVLSKTLSPSHPQIRSLRSEVDEMKRQLEILESGSPTGNSEGRTVLDVPFAQVPSLSLKLARLMREVKIQEAVFELLTQQYEQYKIQESKDTPTIQVLDKAVPPETRAKPRRGILVGLAGVLSLFASTVFVFGLEYFRRSKERDPESVRKLEILLGAWRRDADDLRRKLSFRRKRE
jgi:tyrosine-protein kinase Etk/Wzc